MPNPQASALRSASIYQIFPRNYTDEGTLQAAAARLGEAAELGFDYVYLTPIQPIGKVARKGSLGSPYAIADYRAVDPLLGGEEGLKVFLTEAHRLGLRVILDVVYNHTSPDSVLAQTHPEWFWKGPEGKPAPRIADWSDVVDLDYSHKELWDYQIESLEKWARLGVDGFRCDVASLVPVEFWVAARERLAASLGSARPKDGDGRPLLWLAESVHKEFVTACRRRGLYAASDPELHAAFDLSYDYDGRGYLESAWAGELSLDYYLKHLETQEALYPTDAVKLRFLENHDQGRAAARFGRGARLRNWTLFSMLLPGTYMAYMGEEVAMERRIGLFEREPMKAEEGDASFKPFFARALSLAKQIKAEAPLFDAKLLAEGVVLVRRQGRGQCYTAILNLDGRSGRLELPPSLAGTVLATPLAGTVLASRGLAGTVLMGEMPGGGGSLSLGTEPLVLAEGEALVD